MRRGRGRKSERCLISLETLYADDSPDDTDVVVVVVRLHGWMKMR